MAPPPKAISFDARVMALVHAVPPGRVVRLDDLARHLGAPVPHIVHVLSRLDAERRATTPWHRVVAKGGAIGRGPFREAQLAGLAREGVAVSAAGVVQDMGRVTVCPDDLDTVQTAQSQNIAPKPGGRARGMKDRP